MQQNQQQPLQQTHLQKNSRRPTTGEFADQARFLTIPNEQNGSSKRENNIASHINRTNQSHNTPNRDLTEPNMLQSCQNNDEDNDDLNGDECDFTYLNNYSINATVVKNHHRAKIGLPLSNNEMHLQREDAINSPTASRYSSAMINQGQFPQQQLFSSFVGQGMTANPSSMMQMAHYKNLQTPMLTPFDQQTQTAMQHHHLYERENVGKDMLNLSHSQHSQTPKSYRMASPFQDGKLAPTKEVVYSRSDIKFETNRAMNQNSTSKSQPEQSSGQRDQKNLRRIEEDKSESPSYQGTDFQEHEKARIDLCQRFNKQIRPKIPESNSEYNNVLPVINDQKSTKSPRQGSGTPQTKQGTTTQHEDTTGLLHSGRKTSKISDERQNSGDIRALLKQESQQTRNQSHHMKQNQVRNDIAYLARDKLLNPGHNKIVSSQRDSSSSQAQQVRLDSSIDESQDLAERHKQQRQQTQSLDTMNFQRLQNQNKASVVMSRDSRSRNQERRLQAISSQQSVYHENKSSRSFRQSMASQQHRHAHAAPYKKQNDHRQGVYSKPHAPHYFYQQEMFYPSPHHQGFMSVENPDGQMPPQVFPTHQVPMTPHFYRDQRSPHHHMMEHPGGPHPHHLMYPFYPGMLHPHQPYHPADMYYGPEPHHMRQHHFGPNHIAPQPNHSG